MSSQRVPPEESTLDRIRTTSGKGILALVWVNVALIVGLNAWQGAVSSTVATAAALAFALPATWASTRSLTGPRTRIVSSMALAGTVAVLVAILQRNGGGRSLQLDAHMYFFACLAIVAAWLDGKALVAYAAIVALHHLVLSPVLPGLAFPDGAGFDRVLLHTAVLVAQTGFLVWLVASLQAGVAASRSATLGRRASLAATPAWRLATSQTRKPVCATRTAVWRRTRSKPAPSGKARPGSAGESTR
jgi:methyl-accepting chemotaxis protein